MLRRGGSGVLLVGPDVPGPESIPLFLEQLLGNEVKDFGDRQGKGDWCDRHRPLVALETLAIKPYQIFSLLLL